MDFDIRNDEGELDRTKVVAKLDDILATLPVPCQAVLKQERQLIINLIEEAVDAAFLDGAFRMIPGKQ